MIRVVCTILALLAAAPSFAAEMFAGVGAGVTDREPTDDPPFDQLDLDYDSGTTLTAQLGGRFESGMMLRADYNYTNHDEFTALGGLLISEDITRRDLRLGAFAAPQAQGAFGYRLGVGYARVTESTAQGTFPDRDGYFVEGAAQLDAGQRVTFDLAAVRIHLSDDQNRNSRGNEFRLAMIFHAGAIDVALNGLYARTDSSENLFYIERLKAVSLSVGGAWGER